MRRLGLWNAFAVLVALAASVAMAARDTRGGAPMRGAREVRSHALIDATGARLEYRAFRRIASASQVADRLLVELCARDRIVAFSGVSADMPDAHRYDGLPRIARIDDVEAIARLRPDLVLTHNVGDARRIERLREAGLTVFDLGALEGLATLRDDAIDVAALCGDRARGERFVRTLERRLRSIAGARGERRGALYLGIYGGRLFGGTRGTSYHDVLHFAGLRDVAADRYSRWPQYSAEALLALDPEVIVTRDGMGRAICGHEELHRLRACASGRVVEIDGALLDSPGPEILEAAEAVHDAVYGRTPIR